MRENFKRESRLEKRGREIERKLLERKHMGEERKRNKEKLVKSQRLAADKRRGRLKRERDCMRKGS